MVTKKIRTEYMKRFKDPRWETFSKCYEDSVKYRLTRRVMEHSHKPWFWDGLWDGGSESSGRSTPRPSRNRVTPLTLPATHTQSTRHTHATQQQQHTLPTIPTSSEEKRIEQPPENGENEVKVGEAEINGVVENGVNGSSVDSVNEGPVHAVRPAEETTTDHCPNDTASDGETHKHNNNANNTVPPKDNKRRARRHRTPRSESGHALRAPNDDTHKPQQRAKSQPPTDSRKTSGRLDWTERHMHNDTSDTSVQTRRPSDKRGSDPERRRARSADLEKVRRAQQLSVSRSVSGADDRWTTEYMRCYSARLR